MHTTVEVAGVNGRIGCAILGVCVLEAICSANAIVSVYASVDSNPNVSCDSPGW